MPAQAAAVLERFAVSDADVLGFGGESVVFRLDDQQVLRVPRCSDHNIDLRRRRAFLADLDGRLPFATPLIREIGADAAYTIEALLPGRSMLEALRDLQGAARERTWRSYADAVDAIGGIPRPEPRYGHLLAPDPIAADSWPEFVAACMTRAAEANRVTIEREIGSLEILLAQAVAMTGDLDPMPPRVLVHGDVFPGNVLVDDAGSLTAVLDFGPWTVAGDAKLELAGAYLPLDMLEECVPADAELMRDLMVARHGEGFAPALRCYRAWFALAMADPSNAAPPYRRLYDWSLANLRRLAAGELGGFEERW